MQKIFLFCLFFTLLQSFSLNAEERKVSKYIEKLGQVLSHSIFQQNSKITLNILEPCKVEFSSEWARDVSKRKGFYSVKTFVVVDFKYNNKSTTFTTAHVTSKDGHSFQSWGDVIDVNLIENTSVRKVVLSTSNSLETVSSYSTDYIPIGVAEPDDYNQISELLKAINLVSTRCKFL